MSLQLLTKAIKLRREVKWKLENLLKRPRLYDLHSAERVGVVYRQPTDMCETDRLMLYALTRGLRPERALEIGARWGGSARIITNAMQENGIGQAAGIDPAPEAFWARPRELHGRYTLVSGYSPQAIPEAVDRLGGLLDLVFIDGLHTHDAVLADFLGVLPHLAAGAYILVHDAYHQGISRAVDHVLVQNADLVDLGFITRNPEMASPVSYQGLRLIRRGGVDPESLITAAYKRENIPPMPFDAAFRNFDSFANQLGCGITADDRERIREFTGKSYEV
jgi:predicted O-methyltransferase YrrM